MVSLLLMDPTTDALCFLITTEYLFLMDVLNSPKNIGVTAPLPGNGDC